MRTESVVSEPVNTSAHRGFSTERSSSMTVIPGKPAMSQLENLEAKMANIEVSLSSSNPGRRRKGTSLSGTISARTSPRPESKELRSALQDREAVIQNLRIQLCLGKLPRPSGTPLDDTEKPIAEQKLTRLKIDAENKRIAIRNLKTALDKLDITDNIDIRIRQAELEYALGREELQLLSIVEEARALQLRLDKSKPESNSLFSIIKSGINLSLHAVQSTVGRWAANSKPDCPGLYVEWALDGEGLYRGDRILEINGKIVTYRTREELQKQIGTYGKCQLVVVRKRSATIPHNQLIQQEEDNLRLQHRISYLEDQVRELQSNKDISSMTTTTTTTPHMMNGTSGHVTSISISSPPSTPPDKPQVFQRGNYITTLVGGKPIELTGISSNKSHITKTLIKENGSHTDTENNYIGGGNKSLSASRISINSDLYPQSDNHHTTQSHSTTHRKRLDRRVDRCIERERFLFMKNNNNINNNINNNNNNKHSEDTKHIYQNGNHIPTIHQNGKNHVPQNHLNGNHISQPNQHKGNHIKQNHQNYSHARSVEQLNYNGIDRRKELNGYENHVRKFGNDLRSVKSLDFDTNEKKRTVDYTSEPVSTAPRIRPTPPKKPLRLSLQRAQSLQTVELNQVNENEKKRSLKRLHNSEKTPESQFIENSTPLQTASLGRHKLI